MPPLPPRLAPPAAAAATAAVAAEATAAAEAPFGFRPRFVHRGRPAAELVLIEFSGGLLRLFVGRHFDECESARASGGGIAHDAHRFDGAGATEELLQFRFSGGIRQIAH